VLFVVGRSWSTRSFVISVMTICSEKNFFLIFKKHAKSWQKYWSMSIESAATHFKICGIQNEEDSETIQILILLHNYGNFLIMGIFNMPLGLISSKEFFCTNRTSKRPFNVFWHIYLDMRAVDTNKYTHQY
jgi:hypothetical protein